MKAATAVTLVQRDIENSMQYLSTGKRINTASDDAASVAITLRPTVNIKG